MFSKSDSLSDFDVIFLDPKDISQLWSDHLRPKSDGKFRTNPEEDGGLSRGLQNLLSARREEAIHLTERSGGVIFCKLRKPGNGLTLMTREGERELTIYSWLPNPEEELLQGGASVKTRKGSKVRPRKIATPVADFLRRSRDSLSYEAVLTAESFPEGGNFEPLARTEADEVAAFSSARGSGSMVFLPSGMNLDLAGEEDLVKTAEKVVSGGGYYRPSWLDDYGFSEERDIRAELEDIDRKISELKERKEEKTKELKDLDFLKGLLSARTDYELKLSLMRALQASGFDVEEGNSGIDIMVSDSQDVNLAITVGADPESPVGLEPYHKLVKGINELKIYENEDPQGVVVLNGYAVSPPDEREDQLSEELVEGCNLYGFTVLTAEEVFEMIKEIVKGKVGSRENLIELFENG